MRQKYFLVCLIAISLIFSQPNSTVIDKAKCVEEKYNVILNLDMGTDGHRHAVTQFTSLIDTYIATIQSEQEFEMLSNTLESCGFWISTDQSINVNGAVISIYTLHFSPPVLSYGEAEQNWNWYIVFDSKLGVVDAKPIYSQSDFFVQKTKIVQLGSTEMVVSFTGVSTYNHPFNPFSSELEISWGDAGETGIELSSPLAQPSE